MTSFTKSRSRYLSPLAEVLAEGETWTVGFDKMLSELAERWDLAFEGFREYPRSNIKKTDGGTYQIDIDVAGFTREELKIEIIGDELIVTGTKADMSEKKAESYLHRGIAEQGFHQSFMLADYMQVTDAKLDNGMLVIDLVRNVPAGKEPQVIPIH